MRVWIGMAVIAGLACGGLWLLWPGDDGVDPGGAPAPHAGSTESPEPALVGSGDGPLVEEGARLDAEPEAPAGEGVRFTGTVVDKERQPVRRPGSRPGSAARRGPRRQTDAEGVYTFALLTQGLDRNRDHAGSIVATAPDGRSGLTLLSVHSPRQATPDRQRKVAPIVVTEAVSLGVEVTSTCPGALPATVWVVPTFFGNQGPIATVQTDASGRVDIGGLAPNGYRILAAAEDCGRASAVVTLPLPEPGPVRLEIPHAHTFRIRVLEEGFDAPVEGARVRLQETVRTRDVLSRSGLLTHPDDLLTDAQGEVVLKGLGGKERLELEVSAEGFPPQAGRRGPGRVRVKVSEEEVIVRLHRARTIRWPLEDRGHGVPAEGATIPLRPFANSGLKDIPSEGRIEQGMLVVAGWAPGFAAALAQAEGIGVARLRAGPGAVEGDPTGFERARRIEVVALEADGSPAVGLYLSAYDGGNNRVAPPAQTNDEGRAVLEGLHGGPGWQVTCRLSRGPEDHAAGWVLGTVDLGASDGRFEFRLPRERRVRITVRVDGAPPPEGFRGMFNLVGGWKPLEPDAEGLCEVTLEMGDEGSTYLRAQAGGYTPIWGPTLDLAVPDPLEITLDFKRQGKARVKVVMPKDKRHVLAVQAWDPEKKAWPPDPIANRHNWTPGRKGADDSGWVTFELSPGRYRAFDAWSAKIGPPFTVVAGQTVTSTLDLSRCGFAKGRVVPPAGMPFSGFSVGPVDAPGRRHPYGPAGAGPLIWGEGVNVKDGTFWYRVTGDGPLTLRVFHHTCRPHAQRGFVTINGPREGIELQAIPGAVASVRFDPPLRMGMNPGQARLISVRLYKGAAKGTGIELGGMLAGDGETLSFGGFEPGRYTVWIDTLTSAPLVIPDVSLEGDAIDLGVHALRAGSRFIVHYRVKEGQSPPRVSLSATRVGAPVYTRRTDQAGSRVVLQGLGPGRFQIWATTYGTKGGFNKEIEVDGVADVEHTVDLR